MLCTPFKQLYFILRISYKQGLQSSIDPKSLLF
jgi:hypothetical protein